MTDVAQQGRTVLFVSHNMSAILRLTEETLVIDKGELLIRAPTTEAVDFYLSRGLTREGHRIWSAGETKNSTSFIPLSLRILNEQGNVLESVRSTENFWVDFTYDLEESIKGLRVGIYLITSHGEFVFTSFDTDDPVLFETHSVREAGRYHSRVMIPADLLNGGRYIIGVNASVYRINTYFHDEQALAFNVDPSGAPGTQWPESRLGPIRPTLRWEIKKE